MNWPTELKRIPIAIIGMACRLPGADNLDEYWQLISEGRSAIAEVPPSLLDQELYFDAKKGVRNKTYSKLAALVKSKEFRHDQCPISQELRDAVDHCHLLMCQTAHQALVHAGYDPFNLPSRNVAVYIGHAQGSERAGDNTYGTGIEEAAQFLFDVEEFRSLPSATQQAIIAELIADVQGRMPKVTAQTESIAGHMVAGVITKAFGLTGPFVALNSACASSLQAIMMGVRALQSGQVEMAIVGGASDCKSDSLVLFSAAQSMSATGSRPFDADADGLVMGEGYVCMVMKTLERAMADGDPIQAIVSGAGVASDGKGKSLWAPRKEGQLRAMQRAYEHGLDPSKLQYLEAHSTATQLGDATEISSVTEFLDGVLPAGHKIPVTSVKANIGHTLEAAGMAGVIKSVLCMQHGVIPPAININQINPKIDWQQAPVYVPVKPEPWPVQVDGSPRRAGVNAFGIGGLNMHVVIDEYLPEKARVLVESSPRLNRQGVPATLVPGSDDASLAIIGMGCIQPGALNRQEFWQLLIDSRDPKVSVPPGRWLAEIYHTPNSRAPHRSPTTQGGYITNFQYDWRRHKVPPLQVERADPLQFMLLTAADEAIADSGYHEKPFDHERVGVIMGTEFGGDFSYQLQMALRIPDMQRVLRRSLSQRSVNIETIQAVENHFAEALLRKWPALIDESGSFSSSSLASRITKTWDLMGGAVTIDCGSASPLAALNLASDMLLSGDADMMICCAGQRCMGVTTYEMFAANGMLDASGQPRALFDRGFAGVVPGEGVGVVILKRLKDAQRDGDKVHAIIRSTVAAHHNDWGQALSLSLARSFAAAGVHPSDVAIWETNGTGQSDGDQRIAASFVESQAGNRESPALLGSVVSLLGHASGGTAMASLIKASLALETGTMPGTAGMTQPLSVFEQNAELVKVSATLNPISHQTPDGRRLGVVTGAVKRLIYNVILERGTRLPPRASARQQPSVSAMSPAMPQRPASSIPAPMPVDPNAVRTSSPGAPVSAAKGTFSDTAPVTSNWRICRCGAANLAEWKTKFGMLSNDTRGWYGLSDRPFDLEQKYRLAIVADSPAMLEKKVQIAAQQYDNPAAQGALDQQGIFFRKLSDTKPRIAFLFPGQGSQSTGMLQDLVNASPAARRAMRTMDAVLQRHGYQTFAEMAWEPNPRLGGDVWTTQVAILVADAIVHSALTELGIQADVVAGHSYGEFSALLASQSWSFDQVIAVTRARCDGIEACPTARGGMLATNAPASVLESLAGHSVFAGQVFVANYNSPDQAVMGGRNEALQSFATTLGQHGYQAKLIPVPSPFHTPLMQEAAGPLIDALEAATIRPPRIPLISVVTNAYVSDPNEIRRNLVAHLMSPVRYVDLIRRLAGEEPTVLVEVGPQQTLTRLHQKILEGQTVFAIATDHPKRAGMESLLTAKALLECVGAFTPATNDRRAETKALVRSPSTSKSELLHFDATQVRREKMRQAATNSPPPRPSVTPVAAPVAAPAAKPVVTPVVKPVVAPVPPVTRTTPGVSVPAVSVPIVPVSVAPPVAPVPVVSQPSPQPSPQLATVASGSRTADLETFMVNFVVEQTGYPPEVVELDADLEADLGIDSIKKAQLFGELQEYFDVQPDEDLTLDQFPTLRHIVRFLDQATAGTTQATVEPVAAAIAPTTNTPPSISPVVVTPVARVTPMTPVAPPVPIVSQPSPQPSPQLATVASGSRTADLETFMVNFVVEQTGYPPEVVELDADLEADLGIDSIKKAQLFGELQEYFDVEPDEDLTLDQFPTLRHIVRFLDQATAGTTQATVEPVAAASAPTTNTPPTISPVAVSPVVVTPVARVTPMTPVAPPVPVASQPSPQPSPQLATVASGSRTADLETFMVNFVVEQTGYPPEVVELDADLEADLGIDSIKKAQLFGELQEYFDVEPNEDLTLDQFPTLRHIVRFLDQATAEPPPPDPPSQREQQASVGETNAHPTFGLGAIDSVERSGQPAETFRHSASREVPIASQLAVPLARQESRGVALQRVLRRFADCAEERPGVATASAAAFVAQLSPAVCDELAAMAMEASVPIENVVALAEAIAVEMTFPEAQAVFAVAASPFGNATHAIATRLPLSGRLAASVESQIVQWDDRLGIAGSMIAIVGLPGSTFGVNAKGISLSMGSTAAELPAAASASRSLELRMAVPQVLSSASDLQTAVDRLQSFTSLGPWTAWLSQLRHGAAYRIDSDGTSLKLFGEEEAAVTSETKLLLATSTPAHLRCWIQPGTEQLAFDGRHASPVAPLPDTARQRDASTPKPRNDVARTANASSATPTAKRDVVNEAPMDLGNHLCERYRLQLAELPLSGDTPAMFVPHGAVLILGDNAVAAVLEETLRRAGMTVYRLQVQSDLRATLDTFDALWRTTPIAHLFLLNGRDEVSGDPLDPMEFARTRYRNVTVPYFVTQAWMQRAGEAKLLDRGSLLGLTNLGGDFGFSGRVERPEGGAMTGLLKCLFIEYCYVQGKKDLVIKAVDAPPEVDAHQLVANLCREIAGATLHYEVAYQGDRRFISLATREDVTPVAPAEIRRGGTWIVTGGARGITAECAAELAKRFQLKLHLLGSSQLPPRNPAWSELDEQGRNLLKAEVMRDARNAGASAPLRWAEVEKGIQIDRALSGYERAGVNYVYHCCDVSDRERLASVVAQIRQTDGPIDGILHGAGIDRACRFEKKQRDSVEATIGCKVDGAYHLLTLLSDDPPAHFVALGSITGRFGGNGQTDYGVANEWLCKLASWYRTARPHCRAIGFHFHPWDDVGMAALPEVQAQMKRMQGPELMSKEEGVRHFIRELSSGSPRSEVLITTPEYRDRYYPKQLFEALDEAKQHSLAASPRPSSTSSTMPKSEPPLVPEVECLAGRWISVAVERPLDSATRASALPGDTLIGGTLTDAARIGGALTGGALIVGDNVVGQALAQRLTSEGVAVSILPIGDNVSDTIASLEASWANHPSRHLFVVTGWDPDAAQLGDPSSCRRRTSRGVLIPAFVVHRWLGLVQSAAEATPPSLVAITSMGGDFGLGGAMVPEGGALAGLLKGIYLEGSRRPSDKPRIKVIDFPCDERAPQIVHQVVTEVGSQDPEVEMGYRGGRRHVLRSQQQPSDGLPERSLPRGGVWVVTGGARGITCASALHLGQRYQLKLHLLGASPAPQDNPPWRGMTEQELKAYKSTVVREATRQGRSVNDAWTPIRKDIEIFQSLLEYQRAGVEVHYHQCDVGDWQAVERTLADVRAISGPIEGILHGAGWTKPLKSGVLDDSVTPRVFGPKSDGTLALMLHTMADPVRYFVGFGSISGRFGGNGMSDYAGANDLLAKLVGWYRGRRPDCAASVIHWQTWDDTGMAVQHDAAIGAKSTLGMKYIRASEGVYHLEKELRLGLPHPEVIVFDGHFERIFYPHHEQYAAPVVTSVPLHSQPSEGIANADIKRPLIERVVASSSAGTSSDEATTVGTWTAEVRFDPVRDVFLRQHLLRGKPFLPGVAGLEVLVEAAAMVAPQQKAIRLREVSIINGLLFHDGQPIDASVSVTPVEGGLQCVLHTELRNRKGMVIDPHRVCSQAIVEFGDEVTLLAESFPGDPPTGWQPHHYPDDGLLYHGDALRSMKRCSFLYSGGYGEIVAPPIKELAEGRSADGWIFPVSVLDACVVGCGSFCWIQFGGRLEVPHGFDSLCMIRQPRTGERLVQRLHYLGTEGRHSRFNFSLFGEDRELILQAIGYRTILVGAAGGSA